MLHNDTLSEFKVYEKLGWISIKPTHSITNMEAGNRMGNSIEDKKRPYGMGNGFLIILNDALYNS